MKKTLLLSSAILGSLAGFTQTQGPNDPAAAATVPSSACLACPGEIWGNETDVFLLDNNVAYASVQPYGTCFQSNCYYTRFLYASNFGFTIPGTATIDGVAVDIYRMSGNTNSVTDSTIRLSMNGLPAGANRASSTPWPLAAAYYTYGSSTDLWGLALSPADINTSAFGVYLKVYNQSNTTTTPTVNHIRITVNYTMPTGVQYSQTSEPSDFSIYQNDQEVQVSFILGETIQGVNYEVYNQLGDLVFKKQLGAMAPGKHLSVFSSHQFSNGVYFIRLDANGKLFTKKFIIQN